MFIYISLLIPIIRYIFAFAVGDDDDVQMFLMLINEMLLMYPNLSDCLHSERVYVWLNLWLHVFGIIVVVIAAVTLAY